MQSLYSNTNKAADILIYISKEMWGVGLVTIYLSSNKYSKNWLLGIKLVF